MCITLHTEWFEMSWLTRLAFQNINVAWSFLSGFPSKPVVTLAADHTKAGDQFTATCTTTGGKPQPSITWYKHTRNVMINIWYLLYACVKAPQKFSHPPLVDTNLLPLKCSIRNDTWLIFLLNQQAYFSFLNITKHPCWLNCRRRKVLVGGKFSISTPWKKWKWLK